VSTADRSEQPVTYDQLDMNSQTSPSYEQIHLPTTTTRTTGPAHVYYNVSDPSHINTSTSSPYEQLNIETQKPPVYQELNTT